MKMKKCLAAAMASLLIMAVFPMPVLAEGEAPSSAEEIHQAAIAAANPQPQEGETISGSKSSVFLHGNAVIIAEGDTPGLTKIYLDTNANAVIDAGEESVKLQYATGSPEEGYDLSKAVIYCVGPSDWPYSYTAHEGDILVTMTGGKVENVYGSLLCNNTGNFIFTMIGGRIEGKVCATGSAPTWTGSTYISVSGNASIGQAVYGGSESGKYYDDQYNEKGCIIDGDVHVRFAGDATVNVGGSKTYGDAGVFAGGQQPGSTITGDATVSIEGGTINGIASGDHYNTKFENNLNVNMSGGTVENLVGILFSASSVFPASSAQEVTVNMSGGTVNYNLIGSKGTVAGDTMVSITGGTVKAAVAGMSGGTVGGSMCVNIEGGQFDNGIIGVNAGTASRAQVNVKGGTIAQNVIGCQSAINQGTSVIRLDGGTVGGLVLMKNNGGQATESAIEVKDSPTFSGNGAIRLYSGEFVTEMGEITGGDGSVKIQLAGELSPGRLIVKQGIPGTKAQKAKYTITNGSNPYTLVYGAATSSAENLYLGSDQSSGSIITEVKPGNGAPGAQSDINESKEAYLDEEDNEALLAGKNVRIVLSIDGADNTVTDDVKTAISNQAGQAGIDKIAQYLDIAVTKYIDETKDDTLTTLPNEVKITLDIPQELQAARRKFSIIRTHQLEDGRLETATLSDEDSNPATITFRTDKFSTYALAYKDTTSTNPGGTGSGSSTGSWTGTTQHTYGDYWKYDSKNHWKECDCGAVSEEAAHTLKEVTDRPATATVPGLKHLACTVCGYTTEVVKIPPTGERTPSPQTGGSNNSALPIILLVAGSIGLAGTSVSLRRRKYSK